MTGRWDSSPLAALWDWQALLEINFHGCLFGKPTVGTLYIFIKLLCWRNTHKAISGKLILEVGWHQAECEGRDFLGFYSFVRHYVSHHRRGLTHCYFELSSRLKECEVQSVILPVSHWEDEIRRVKSPEVRLRSHTERVCFLSAIKLFRGLRGSRGTAAARSSLQWTKTCNNNKKKGLSFRLNTAVKFNSRTWTVELLEWRKREQIMALSVCKQRHRKTWYIFTEWPVWEIFSITSRFEYIRRVRMWTDWRCRGILVKV